ncbi:hypothetical protein SARC_07686 [Sphaeroforma arctica JP610]|uniref:Uncharacterized protein n=1 Tax=Sphaeroforma arctica JP610 TaxID=667725 RepID=A0A0L0FSZ7_9EUKA|nr:hypothetical protein SARC_07686 [Sphaeroforma arctica JP610]KNC79937.1 hypothetical protein SARC_07686 [Sphaeroforma arctica JP610]|eukprot:XP_014153839.1 hypothetical protein SARC_07686 [Sphaeroforma arctica JP610]
MSEFDAENKVKIAMIATMDEQHSTGTTPNRGKARLSSAIKAPNPSKRGHDETTSTPKRTPRSAKRYERENRDTLESPLIERIRSLNKVPGREDRNSLDNSENIEPSTLNFNQFASPMRKPQTPMNAAKARWAIA